MTLLYKLFKKIFFRFIVEDIWKSAIISGLRVEYYDDQYHDIVNWQEFIKELKR